MKEGTRRSWDSGGAATLFFGLPRKPTTKSAFKGDQKKNREAGRHFLSFVLKPEEEPLDSFKSRPKTRKISETHVRLFDVFLCFVSIFATFPKRPSSPASDLAILSLIYSFFEGIKFSLMAT